MPDIEAEPVLCSRPAGVAVITLNRPERLSAWILAVGAAYRAALERFPRPLGAS
ncbi:MAG TPA: hypothetical protein VNT55_22270 [Baekduia sp.]|nr:hypothetical protein [Baekduia sp.]